MMYKFRTQRPNALILVLLYLALLVVTSISATVTAKAATIDDHDIDKQARSFIYLQAFSTCMAGNSLSSYSVQDLNNQWIDPDQAINGNFFAERSNNPVVRDRLSAFDISLGYINTSKLGCHESGWIQDALRLWGWDDNIVALQDFGFTTNGEGDYIPPQDRGQKFVDAVTSKYYGSNNIKSYDAVRYAVYSEAFKQICGATSMGPKAGATPSNLALINTDNGYVLKIVNDKYELEEVIFKANLGKGEKIDVFQGEYISCIAAVDKANQFAEAYKTYMQQNKDKEPAPGVPPVGSGSTGGGSGCDDALSPFGWVLCPMISFANNAYGFLADWIQQILFFDSKEYSDSQLKEASAIFVRLANILIVLFALLAIAAQVFNFEFLSTYTIKKILPKLFIGAILIQFSWPLFTTMIQIVNAIGSGLYYLLLLPFDINVTGNGYVTLGDIFSSGTNSGGAGNVGGSALAVLGVGLGVVAINATGAWLSIIVLALGVIVSVMVAILTLIVRQVILIVLLAIAPLALAFWIFPGTNKYWDLWWKSFSKLLLMYPLIMLLLAGGTMAAIILSSASASGGLDLNKIAAIIAYFAPIFLIGWTFKFAGQAFGSVAALSNKWGSKAAGSGMFGLRDRAKISRDNSDWALSKRTRDEDRARNIRQGYANRISGTSTRGRAFKYLAGTTAEGRTRAEAGAAAAITKEEQQQYQDESALAQFNVNRLAASSKIEGLTGDRFKYVTDASGVKRLATAADQQQMWNEMTEYQRRDAVREQIMNAHTSGQKQVTFGGVSTTISDGLVAHTALQALANKDDYKDANDPTSVSSLDTYVDSEAGFTALNDLGTKSPEAYQTLVKKAAYIAKGVDPMTTDPATGTRKLTLKMGDRGFDDAVAGIGELGRHQYEQVMDTITTAHANGQTDAVAAQLATIARNSSATNATFGRVAKSLSDAGIGADTLSELRNNENATIKWTGTKYEIS